MINAWLWMWAGPSDAWVGAAVQVEGTVIDEATAQSVVWHALADLGHPVPLVVGGSAEAAVPQMRRSAIGTLLHIDVSWERSALWRDGRMLWVEAPTLAVTEYAVAPEGLRRLNRYGYTGEPQVGRTEGGWTLMPAATFAMALGRIMDELAIPAWGSVPPDTLRVPVVVATDAAYRRRHGPSWADAVHTRIRRASALLNPAGIELTIQHFEEWSPVTPTSDPVALLADLAASDAGQRAIRIGLSGAAPPTPAQGVEAVGAAYVPGRYLVVMDQHVDDVSQDGTAIAHEVLHALGVPHQDRAGVLGSATLVGPVHRLTPASVGLARAAAHARWAHWDPGVAAVLLADAAADHLPDRELRLAYVARNLAAGQGDRDAHSHKQWAALARDALGR